MSCLLSLVLFTVYLSWINCFGIVRVRTTSGTVQGRSVPGKNGFVDQFLNIPYAEPPLGRLRFSRPEPIRKPIKGIIDGTKTGNACFQSKIVYDFNITVSEDCLVLNVWTKRDSHRVLKPVMVWIHGGGYTWGTIFQPEFNGSQLVSYGVVIVTVSYRLGPLGFLYGDSSSAPGNVGLYDQSLAFHWVKNNIHLFGGDSNQITLFGESAGGWSASAHMISPLTRGLFKRAILESGLVLFSEDTPRLTKEEAYRQARALATYFNCNDDNQWLDCLRRVDAKTVNSYENITSRYIFGTEYLPLTAQQAFRTKQFNQDIEIIAGVLQNEGSLLTKWIVPEALNLHSLKEFRDLVDKSYPSLDSERITRFYLRNVDTNSSEALKLAFYDFMGDLEIKCSSYLFAKLFARCFPRNNVYFYYWTYVSPYVQSIYGCTQDMGVCHQSEIPYVLGNSFGNNTIDNDFSEYSMTLWTNFAKYGNPMKGFSPNYKWPRFLINPGQNNQTLTKEMNPFRRNNIIGNKFAENCEGFWKTFFL